MPTRRLVTIVVVAVALGFGATAVFASFYHNVRDQRVRHHLDRARDLAARGDVAAASDQYAAALLIERDDLEAGRGLALTLLALNRLPEAESYFRELLVREPTDGALHRGLARIAAARGEDADARISYQRAIYGEWPEPAAAERIDTRFELIDHLRRRGARDEVIAELLRLKAEVPSDRTAVARRIADLLVEQGAAPLAMETLETAAAAAPRDVELLAQLAELQLNERRVREAAGTLRRAAGIEPARADIGDRVQVVERILRLDPTLPDLRLVTRTRRARIVLQAVVEQTQRCAKSGLPDAEPLARAATRRLRQRARATAESAEEDLEIAARLWAAYGSCHEATPEGRALTYVLERVMSETRSRP